MHFFRFSFYLIGFLSFIIWIFDSVYVYFYGKPVLVHSYFRKKSLSLQQKMLLKEQVKFYKKLDVEYQKYFEHRLADFIDAYQLIGRHGYVITDETKVLIGSVYIMMTFGMRNYLTNVFEKIVLYPSQFRSNAHNRNHKGEFNFRYKTIVFSWKDFTNGIVVENDNLHLGVHEFMHALSFHGRISKDYSAKVFNKMHKEILSFVKTPENIKKIKSENYFRKYAYTNSLEFMAVMMEYFFESPIEFQERFPELYIKVVKMINYKSFSNWQ